MDKIATKIQRIALNAFDGKYIVTFTDSFKGFVLNKESGEYVESDINQIMFTPRYFKAIAFDCVDGLSFINDCKMQAAYNNAVKEAATKNVGFEAPRNSFGFAELNLLLKGAEITLVRSRFSAGDEYTLDSGETATHEHDGYNTEVENIVVSAAGQARIDAMVDRMLLM